MEDSSGVIIRERLSYASPPHIPLKKLRARARENHTGALPHLYACPTLTYMSLSSQEWVRGTLNPRGSSLKKGMHAVGYCTPYPDGVLYGGL